MKTRCAGSTSRPGVAAWGPWAGRFELHFPGQDQRGKSTIPIGTKSRAVPSWPDHQQRSGGTRLLRLSRPQQDQRGSPYPASGPASRQPSYPSPAGTLPPEPAIQSLRLGRGELAQRRSPAMYGRTLEGTDGSSTGLLPMAPAIGRGVQLAEVDGKATHSNGEATGRPSPRPRKAVARPSRHAGCMSAVFTRFHRHGRGWRDDGDVTAQPRLTSSMRWVWRPESHPRQTVSSRSASLGISDLAGRTRLPRRRENGWLDNWRSGWNSSDGARSVEARNGSTPTGLADLAALRA